MFEMCEWLNEPPAWTTKQNVLQMSTAANTDFWRETQYGFVRDSGHFFGLNSSGDFQAQIRVAGSFGTLYDQAGLMVRLDQNHWVKAGAEFTDGSLTLSTVLTMDRSDWGLGPTLKVTSAFWIRATVAEGVLRIQYSTDGIRWPLLRVAPFPIAGSYLVGPMCCSPKRAGLSVEFSAFEVGALEHKDLHDLT